MAVGITVHSIDLTVVNIKMRKKITALFVNLNYNTIQEKIFDLREIGNIYVSMENDLKKCIQFDPSFGAFWTYHFKYTFQDNEGNKRFCYLKDCKY